MQANLVPYASVSVAVQDVLGGHADAIVADLASTAQLVKQGRMRLLAVTAGKRVAGWEQTPSLAELFPNFEMTGWFAIVAPVGTPANVIQRMNTEVNLLLADADLSQRMLTIGPIAEAMGPPARVDAFLKQEMDRWAEVSKEIGLLPE